MTRQGRVRRVWVLYFLGVVGCASSPHPPSQTPRPTEQRRLASARSLEELAASVEAFEARPDAPAQRELAKVLQSLGSAMEPLSHATNLRVREVAKRLAGSPPTSLSHAGLLRQALTRVLESLTTTTSPPRRRVEYVSALRALRQTTQALDDLVALANQRPRTVAALHAAADAVFLARGGEAPFGEAQRMEEPPAPLGSFEAELDRARDDVSMLAQTNLTGAGKAAAAALSALGNVIEAADDGNRLGKQVAEIRFQAERLERAHASAFGQPGWIRSGLESAVDALAALHAGDRSSPWLRIAQRAVANIEQRSWLSFERAQVQDAFRATVDAFAALAQCREEPVPPKTASP